MTASKHPSPLELASDKSGVRTEANTATSPAKLSKGDIVLNGWASPGFNDLHIIVGSGSIKQSRYSSTPTYKTRCLFKGKLGVTSMFVKRDHRLTKIGHCDYEEFIKQAMISAREAHATEVRNDTE